MMESVITLTDEKGAIAQLFVAEEQEFVNDRASYKVAHVNNQTIISVVAKDASSLRAVMNSICKTLIVFEKADKVVNDGSKTSN